MQTFNKMETIKTILIGLLGFILAYLLFSFVQWNFNAGNWEISIRGGCMFLGMMFNALFVSAYKISKLP